MVKHIKRCSTSLGLPWWLSGKKSASNAENAGSILRSGRSPGGGHGNSLQHSCLENPMNRGAWWATSHGAADTTAATEHACTTSLVISEMQINITIRLSWQSIWLHRGRPEFYPWVRKVPWRRERLPTPVFWPGEFHGLYSPQGHKESDITEQLSLSHFTYTC